MIQIRVVKPSELDSAKDFIQSIFPNALVHINDEDTVLLAEFKEEVVGFVHMVDDPEKIIIRGIGVERSMRGQGVGTMLMDHVMDMVEDDGRPIYLKARATNPVIELYSRYGFVMKRFGSIYVLVKKPNS